MGQSSSSNQQGGPSLTASGHVYLNRYPWCKYFSYIRTLFACITVCSKFLYMNLSKFTNNNVFSCIISWFERYIFNIIDTNGCIFNNDKYTNDLT